MKRLSVAWCNVLLNVPGYMRKRVEIRAVRRMKTTRSKTNTMVPMVVSPLKVCGWTAMSNAIPPVLIVTVNHLQA